MAKDTMKVVVTYELPPGPVDQFYSAYDDDAYDPFDEIPSAVGTGATEAEAIESLVELTDWTGTVEVVKRFGYEPQEEGPSAPRP